MEFKETASKLFERYAYEQTHTGDMVLSKNGFDYIIAQLTENFVIRSSSSQLNDKYKKDFNDWMKTEIIETDINGIWVNGTFVNDDETIFDVFEEMT